MNNKKTIWLINQYSSTPETAMGGRHYYLAQELAKKGYKVYLIAGRYSHLLRQPKQFSEPYLLEKIDTNFFFVWVNLPEYQEAHSKQRVLNWFKFSWALTKLPSVITDRPDAILYSSPSPIGYLGAKYLANKFKSKFIFEVRDIWPLTIVEEGGFSPNNPFVMLLAKLECFAYKTADVIVGTMPNLGEHVNNILGYSKPTYCIPMGFDPNVLSLQQSADPTFISEYFRDGKFYVVYAGTVGITNALETFFSSAEKLANHEDIHFIVLGGGALKSEYMSRYAHCNNISFMQKVPRLMVQSVLSHADVLYLSTFNSKVWNYGQSLNKLIDYMVAARPIIASYSGYRSMVDESGAGFFVPAEDVDAVVEKILLLKGMSIQDRKEMGIKGREWILQNRNYKKLALDYAEIIFSDKKI